MDKLKDPAMLLSVINTVGLLGETFYFYKQVEAIHEDIAKLNTNVTKLVTTMADIKKLHLTTKEQNELLTSQVNQINNTVNNLSSLTDDVTDIIETLYDHDIEIVQSDRSHRSGDRRDNRGGKYQRGNQKG